MTDKEFKKEKEELRTLLFNKINTVRSNADLKSILQIIDAVKLSLDHHDSSLENALDDICIYFSSSLMQKIKKSINDILDDYGKTDKKGNYIYSENQNMQIYKMLEEIDNICNRNFWVRFANVLKGS